MASSNSSSLRACCCGVVLLAAAASVGCQSDYAGQTLPSAYWQKDDIQYFPPGPEFKLSREAAAMKTYGATGPRRPIGAPPSPADLPPRPGLDQGEPMPANVVRPAPGAGAPIAAPADEGAMPAEEAAPEAPADDPFNPQ